LRISEPLKHTEPLLGADVIFQNYSLMENDRVTPDYAMTRWRNGIQIRLRGIFEDEA
jgi:hypothetical protein